MNPPGKSLYQATAQVSDEEHIEHETLTLWCYQPCDEFLYADTVQL